MSCIVVQLTFQTYSIVARTRYLSITQQWCAIMTFKIIASNLNCSNRKNTRMIHERCTNDARTIYERYTNDVRMIHERYTKYMCTKYVSQFVKLVSC